MVGFMAFGSLAEIHLIPPPSWHGEERSSFPSSAPPDDTVESESMVGFKLGDSGVIIRCQVDKFT